MMNDDIFRLLYLLFTYDCNVINVLAKSRIYIFHFNRRLKLGYIKCFNNKLIVLDLKYSYKLYIDTHHRPDAPKKHMQYDKNN